jgi:hypothetical protein
MAPVKTKQVRNNYSPWVDEEIKEKMRERDSKWKEADLKKDAEILSQYRKLRNEVTSMLREAKTQWRKDKLRACGSNTGSTWACIKGWLNWHGGDLRISYW